MRNGLILLLQCIDNKGTAQASECIPLHMFFIRINLDRLMFISNRQARQENWKSQSQEELALFSLAGL